MSFDRYFKSGMDRMPVVVKTVILQRDYLILQLFISPT